jgi:hypothetical protein
MAESPHGWCCCCYHHQLLMMQQQVHSFLHLYSVAPTLLRVLKPFKLQRASIPWIIN